MLAESHFLTSSALIHHLFIAGGDVEQDFWLAFDLLRSHKDHVEFTVVRDWVQQVGG